MRLVVSVVPFVGDINDAIAVATGYDIIWDEHISREERALYAAGLLIGSGSMYRKGLGLADEGAQGFVKGYPSHRAFTKAMGKAGPGNHWHHIVGQNARNVNQFRAQALHNAYNMMRLDSRIHHRVNGYYSSIQDFSEGMRVRDWLGGQSYEAQREFSLQTLRKFGAFD